MPLTKFYGKFPITWRAGHLEQEIIDSISNTLKISHANMNCVVASTTLRNPINLLFEDIKNLQPDLTVICALSDPLNFEYENLENIPGTVIPFGYFGTGKKFDFWALACLNFFRQYTFQELQPTNFKYVFLNYNRKPHNHRIKLVELLERNNLTQYGIITLGNSKYTIDDKAEDYLEYGVNDVFNDVGIPNDIYSLGRLDIWKSSFLNIVSETQYECTPHAFVSEKVYKPIIGLRPFIVNGTPDIYIWLKEFGFDCFEDIFPISKLLSNDPIDFKFRNHEIICEVIKELSKTNLEELYKKLLPRLIYNQNLFYKHANNQKNNFQVHC